jgi:biopolymer transport protein ExbB
LFDFAVILRRMLSGQQMTIKNDDGEVIVAFSLFELFRLGGIFMWPLLGFSIAACAIALERFVYLLSRNLHVEQVSPDIVAFCERGAFAEAKEALAPLQKRAPFAAILREAIDRKDLSEANLEKILENEAGALINKFEAGFNYLTAIGSLAPLTGFLGTVSGMIGAFRSIAEATEVNAQIVANGIYEALITTVFGLIIAIIAMVSHSLLSHIVDTFSLKLEKALTDMIIALKGGTKTA